MSSKSSEIKSKTKAEFLDQFRRPEHRTEQADDKYRRWSDARSIREEFGVDRYGGDVFDYRNIVPNIIQKTWDPEPGQIGGGTDLLATGRPGSGKSTLANHLALREIEVPEAKLVWRASTSRSEWLPLAPWTTLVLPKGVEYEAIFEPLNKTEKKVILDLDELEEHVVRSIERYDDPRDLNRNILEPAQIHVVYPDPEMRGVQEIYEQSDDKQYDAPTDRRLFEPEDPSTHWWFGWILARIEHGPYDWTTLILDEIGDIASEDARKDSYGTYQKVELLKDAWVDARKKGLSIYAFGHSERDIHNMIRHKIRWRVSMPNAANPTAKSEVVGFGAVPMNTDMTSRMPIGEALFWNEQNFEKISWPNYPAAVSHKLNLSRVG